MKLSIIKSIILVLFFINGVLFSQVPQTISYQGVLTDTDGAIVPDGDYSIVFTLYDALTGGTNLWTETQTVTVSGGLFNVILGSVNPINLEFDKQYWLGISIEGGDELTPRTELTSSAYSLNTRNIPDNIVTAEKVADGNLVRSINSLKDNITLAAGSNVNISESGNTITISATGGSSGDNLGNHTATQNIKLNGHWLSGDGGNEGVYVKNNGYVGVGTSSPSAALHVNDNDGVLFQGAYGSGTALNQGAGTRMMWYPKKAAFRAGYVGSTQWDDANIGNYSTAMGKNTTASGYSSTAMGDGTTASGYSSTAMGYGTTASRDISTAMGNGTTASGNYSTAMGSGTTASGYYSTAMGYETTASGDNSTAIGYETTASGNRSTAMGDYTTASGDNSTAMGSATTASGDNSTAMGFATKAESYISLAVGRYNKGGGTPNNWISSDPLFEIGNGTSSNRSNAVTVLKNGNVGIGTATPAHKLQLHNTSSGYVYTSFTNSTTGSADGSGVLIGLDAGEDFRIHSFENNNIKFYINDAEKMRIASSGNVGIGTTSPDYKLEVNGSAGKPGGGSWTNSSDIRLKDVKGKYNRGLKDILKLKPIKFNYKVNNPRNLPSDIEYVGFIAQEVEKVFPEAISKGKDGYLDFNMHSINVAMVNAIKEQEEKIKNQDTRIKQLEKENQKLKTVIEENNDLKNEIRIIKAALNKLMHQQPHIALTKAR